MENIKIEIYGEEIFVRPRKEDETREDYRNYLEERYDEEFPHKNYSFFRIGKKLKQYSKKEKAINKLERKSYAKSFKENKVNFCVPSIRGLLGFVFRAATKKINSNSDSKKESKNGFIKNIFSRKDKNKPKKESLFKKFKKNKRKNKVEEIKEFEENLPKLETKDDFEENFSDLEEKIISNLPESEEEFEENLPELEEEFEENLPELEEEFEENLPELDEEQSTKHEEEKSLPIEIKSWRNLTPEESRNINMLAQMKLLQKENKKQGEAISNLISNFSLYQENMKKLEKENLRLRREVQRLSYNPNSFVIKNAYEEAMIENEKFDIARKINKGVDMLEEDFYKDDLTANPYKIGSVSFVKDENEKAKILTKYNEFKNNSIKK